MDEHTNPLVNKFLTDLDELLKAKHVETVWRLQKEMEETLRKVAEQITARNSLERPAPVQEKPQ